jgi:DNA-binding response OmpR family regulator
MSSGAAQAATTSPSGGDAPLGPRVLLVDDDEVLAGMLCEYLNQDGFAADYVTDGVAGVAVALAGHHEIVVLDVMMPRLNGIEALRRIRHASRVPVLMLTAKGSDVDRILGLELGADDYVPKPCTPRELAARLRAILRRAQPDATATAELSVGALSLSPSRRSATWQGQRLDLTSTEFNLLATLARHAGQVVSKADLSEHGLGRPIARFDRSIDVHMSSIRQKLGRGADGRSAIQTVRGIGYQLIRE